MWDVLALHVFVVEFRFDQKVAGEGVATKVDHVQISPGLERPFPMWNS